MNSRKPPPATFEELQGRLLPLSGPAAEEARDILRVLCSLACEVPSLSLPDEQSATIAFEWVSPTRRLGLICDPIPGDSSWFFVDDKSAFSRAWYSQVGFPPLESSGKLRLEHVPKLVRAFSGASEGCPLLEFLRLGGENE